ncbi:MAG: hypothetical protein K2X82_10935 [Gemmataceae bacterium]|nr:hypothetical protein [Gemmataceae bacterium]
MSLAYVWAICAPLLGGPALLMTAGMFWLPGESSLVSVAFVFGAPFYSLVLARLYHVNGAAWRKVVFALRSALVWLVVSLVVLVPFALPGLLRHAFTLANR